MISKPNATAFALIFFAAGGAYGAIPQPDGIVFGTVRVDGASVDKGRDFVVLARAEGFEAPIAVYRMGDLPAAGDHYVLHLPHSLQLDGTTPDSTTPPANAIARVLVIEDGGSEVFAGEVPIPRSGKVTQMNLNVSAGDLAAARTLGASGVGGCGAGGLCGAMGMMNLAWIMVGLVSMKAANGRRRLR